MKYKGYYLLFLVLVLLDQFTKQIFISSFDVGQSIIVNPYLSWTYLQNTGAAFSILAGGGGVQKAFLKIAKTDKKRYVLIDNSKDNLKAEKIIFNKFIQALY